MTQLAGDLDAALTHFRGFFQELDRTFLERRQVLDQVALALLSREHVLLAGPPGTAKSGLVRAVVDRVVDRETNEPSVYARQLTESTVQTDLIGPIDFKVLTETGRTEHFTDEGMLGAIHAHLDEVFDGRDMLLRTTLNLLHERELKHGMKVTRGAIECALMTSNRYISEVLEQSRENLLAFVDRIAFLSFVPRGFATDDTLDRVLRTRLGRASTPTLAARLTIQDVDALQRATDAVRFPVELVPRLSRLLSLFHDETQAAVRADPTFVPTRYLSTRTAVRLGRLLKAIVVWDRVFGDHEREMVVRAEDFPMLRLSLVLTGPEPAALERLLESETDPRERAQLGIMRTEREIFDRCLDRMPPAPKIKRSEPSAPAEKASRSALDEAIAEEAAPKRLLEVTKELTEQVAAAGVDAEPAEALLDEALTALIERALRRGLSAGAGSDAEIPDILDELDELAAALDETGDEGVRLAQWLRGRSVELVDRALTASPMWLAVVLPEDGGGLRSADEVRAGGDAALARFEALTSRRRRLVALGIEPSEASDASANALRELDRLGDVLAAAWDGAMVERVRSLFESAEETDLDAVFEGLGPLLAETSRHADALSRLGAPRDLLKDVCGPRLRPLLEAAFARFDATDRPSTADEVDSLLISLQKAGLEGAVRPADIIHFSAEALLRAEPEKAPECEATYDGYLALRSQEQRTSLAVALVGVAERLARDGTVPTEPGAIMAMVGGIDPSLREQILSTDLARVDRALTLLEDFWGDHPEESPARDRLRAVVRSRFFQLVIDDDAMTRFALELDVLGRLFPGLASRISPLSTRLEKLKNQCMDEVLALVNELSDARFDEVAPGGK